VRNKRAHWNFSKFKREFDLKIWESRLVFYFRKLNEIARGGIKIREFAWRYEIQFGTLFLLGTSYKSPRILN
jgi:hypothetical protein